MGKALTATTISPHEFCSNTTPKGGAITDCTTLVLALFTSNDAAAMLSGGSSSTSTSRTIAVLVSAATCFASSSADSAASPEETPPTSLSSAESVSSASLLDTREPRSACARRARGGTPPTHRTGEHGRAHARIPGVLFTWGKRRWRLRISSAILPNPKTTENAQLFEGVVPLDDMHEAFRETSGAQNRRHGRYTRGLCIPSI